MDPWDLGMIITLDVEDPLIYVTIFADEIYVCSYDRLTGLWWWGF